MGKGEKSPGPGGSGWRKGKYREVFALFTNKAHDYKLLNENFIIYLLKNLRRTL